MSIKKYKVLGLMSGSSFDGLDIAYCEFNIKDGELDWKLLKADLYPFSEMWHLRLKEF